MASIITIAGEKLFAAKAQANEQLDIDTFIFANVPGQDATAPISREEGLPSDYIVHQQIVQQVGRINDNVVVYSTVLDSVTGPFEFNWVGLYSSVNNTLVAINHIPTTPKTVTADGVAGNTLNRNFGIEYSGIADLTGIDVAPETWQLDFTARLQGMDDLTRNFAKDLNGQDSFIDDGLKVELRETLNTFSITPGVGYISGLRVELAEEQILNTVSYPVFVYAEAWFESDANSVWKPQLNFTLTADEIDDYADENGRTHYVTKIALINAVDDVEDLRELFDFRAEDGKTFRTVADALSILANNSMSFLSRLDSKEIKLETTWHNALSKKGGAKYVVKNLLKAELEGDVVDGVIVYDQIDGEVVNSGWIGANYPINNKFGLFLVPSSKGISISQLGANEFNFEESIPKADSYCRDKGTKLTYDMAGEIHETVRVHTGKYAMDFTESKIVTHKKTPGIAWEFSSDDDGVTLPTKNTTYEVRGFTLEAGELGEGVNLCDGMHIGRLDGQEQGESARVRFVNPIVKGAFSYNVVLRDHLFINSIINPFFTGGYNGNLRVLTKENAGENIGIFGGVIANAHNQTNTATNILVDVDANADIYLHGVSIDYGDKQIVMYSGAIHGTAHIESNSNATDVELIETNNQPITFNLTGGTIATGPLPSPSIPEVAGGKPALIEITGSKINCVLTGVGNSLRDKVNTEFVKVNSGFPIVQINAPFYDTSVDKPVILSRYLNAITNGDFESFNENYEPTSWQRNGSSGASIVVSEIDSLKGAHSLRFEGTQGSSFSALQKYRPNGKVKYTSACKVKVSMHSGGAMELVTIFRDWQGNQIGSRTAKTKASTAGTWLLIGDTAPIPASTYEMEIKINANGFIGIAYVDDVVVNLI